MADAFLDPIVQYGFAGMCGVLLLILCWLVSRLLCLLEKTSSVIAGNTSALRNLLVKLSEGQKMYTDLRDRIMTRPCLLQKKDLNNE
jgi:hypothetical protein